MINIMRYKYLRKSCRVFKWSFCIIVLMAALIFGCAKFDRLTNINMTFPNAEFCKECHIDIYNEWVESRHAKAYTSNTYRQATNDYQFTSCLACHVPEPTVSEGSLKRRDMFREEGVTCSSCHLEESKMLGPIEPTSKLAPHPMGVMEDRYRNSKFCGRCHEGTFKEWEQVISEEKHTCQECHMPSVKKKLTQATHLLSKLIVAVSMEKEALQKRHTFGIHRKLPDMEPLTINLKREGKLLKLILKNHLPHSVPTGDFGFRVVIVDILAVEDNGSIIPVKSVELVKEINTAIPAKASISWLFPVPDNVMAIRCVVSRHSKGSENREELYQDEVQIP